MKIRLLGNTIRLRLKVFEVESIRDTGLIEEVLEFGPSESNQLRFGIRTGEDEPGSNPNPIEGCNT